jgi:YesN/AraC family two-component response regulator
LPVIRQAPLLAASLALTDQEEEELTLKTLPLHSPGLLPKSKPLILLVEDEEDLIIYLQSLLQSEYDLLTAPNGQQGWEMAVDYIPDIIVSDVMMPVMDGFAFLKKVKSNPRTSHIPAILLTARTDQAGKLEGLEKGAEAYLTKPFQKEELFIRIRKLLELRKTLQQRYRSMEEIPYEPASGFPLEDQFMSRIREILDSQLDNETFGITELCRELAMSRTQVYRKFSALTDMTVHQYLRRFRLHQAKKLLLRSDLPVSQVALEVGISNPSYFSRAFTKEFGINPSRVRRTSFS